jgi:hypothetical protein
MCCDYLGVKARVENRSGWYSGKKKLAEKNRATL